ncbi:PAS domain S-box-containing protein [Actinoplanes octamycinicus]|uniref:histidine kinase n=1 Tax=Actinoplanes octamycinicus TaxID=135948 RepID=A0A7W7GXP5_9ACTN|nr:PAS domain-containing sensor histidine kinase [Actinoplanes octamycinicus]MBB4740231.1 PAS domain S-box-containing protein [Actinoplanes octamycinicus]GIE59627.1 histidine kinase [Actinoplanes octamycinicus]
MPDQMFLLANLVIMVAYAAITTAILVPVSRAGQLRTNRLATATALIFFSCSVGHGLHALSMLLAELRLARHPASHAASADWFWTSAAWDVLTATVAVYYWTLRRSYGLLLARGAIYDDPWSRNRLDEADARERAARDVAEAQRAMLATVVQDTEDAIAGLTPDGRFTAWNGGAERLFGYTAEEVLGQPVSILAERHGTVADQMDVLSRVRGGARSVSYEARRLRKDGTVVDVAMTVSPIRDPAGTVTGISLVARDITAAKESAERQRAVQERTQQAQRMESLGNLAGGVAHDFNNILAIIANYTEFAIEETAGQPAVQADLVQVRTAVERATNLTRQLLTFTRGDAIQPRDVSLNAALAEVQAMLERTIGEHIHLVTVPSATPLTVHADPGQVQQVLLNLAINARDAMPDGGTLVLEANTADLDGDEVNMQPPLPAGRYARLLISDTGEGIPPEVAERVFEPFFTTKPRGKGTGLGLATVYGIITEAGGSINLYSEPGVGTTFRIYLPLVESPTETTDGADRRTDPPRGDGRTVLVVEDEVALSRIITRILTENDYRVLTAADGTTALSMYRQHGCDLLLTDVIMPGMSGPRLAELLHEHRPDLPVIYMSGYSNGLLGTTHVLEEDIAFLEKPFTAADLLHKVAATRTAGAASHTP